MKITISRTNIVALIIYTQEPQKIVNIIIHLHNWNQNRTVYRYSKEGLGAVDQSLLKRD